MLFRGVVVSGDDPSSALWSYWRRFESPRNVEDLLARRGHTTIVGNASSISFCVKQASDLYRSASNASLLTRPILLFYGMVALLKALALQESNPSTTSDELDSIERSGHGLKLVEWTASKPWSIEQEEVVVNKQGRGFFSFMEQRLNNGSQELPYGRTLTLRQLLACIPEVAQSYEDYFHEPSKVVASLRAQVYSGGFLRLNLNVPEPLMSVGEFFAVLPNLRGYVEEPDFSYGGTDSFVLTPVRDPRQIPGLLPASEGGFVLIPPLDDYMFSALSLHYLAMYALSIVSRYKVDKWGELLEGKQTGIGYLIQDFADSSVREFPRLVLEKFLRQVVVVRSSSSLGSPIDLTHRHYMDLQRFEDYQQLAARLASATRRTEKVDILRQMYRYGESASKMLDIIASESDPATITVALQSPTLQPSSSSEAQQAIAGCLASRYPEVRAHAAKRLTETRDVTLIPLLEPMLEDMAQTSIGSVRSIAMKALASIEKG
jgi:hypothetical protein